MAYEMILRKRVGSLSLHKKTANNWGRTDYCSKDVEKKTTPQKVHHKFTLFQRREKVK